MTAAARSGFLATLIRWLPLLILGPLLAALAPGGANDPAELPGGCDCERAETRRQRVGYARRLAGRAATGQARTPRPSRARPILEEAAAKQA